MKKIYLLLSAIYICFAGPPGPLATFVVPRDLEEEWTGCEFQEVLIALTDVDGVNPATILFEFDGELITWPDTRLSIEDDTLLIFIPASPLTNNTLYEYTLHAADDNDGYPLQSSPVSNSFSTDFDMPYFFPDTRFPIQQ
mgnify:CR=1 FL=1